MKFASIAEFVEFLSRRPAAVEEARKVGMEAAGKMLVQTAQDMIGEEIPGWADLAPSTVAEKTRLGYVGRVSATDPLLRTGGLRASISYEVEGNKLVLGSDDPVALFQEFGTSRIPPRPFIGDTMHVFHPEAAEIIANFELGAATGLRGPLKPLPDHQGRDG
jgi:phage gpG-like protein